MILKVNNNITLKSLEANDAKDIFHIIDTQRAYLGEWLPFVDFTKRLNDSEAFVKSVVEAPQDKFEHVFSIRKNDQFIGLIGFKSTDKINAKTEIGYWISQDYQKQGIVTESVKRICALAFQELQMNRIQIKCAVGNLPSRNIPIKLGFKFEGIERAGERVNDITFRNLEVYSLLKSEFKSN